jgi:hypothetical protein
MGWRGNTREVFLAWHMDYLLPLPEDGLGQEGMDYGTWEEVLETSGHNFRKDAHASL